MGPLKERNLHYNKEGDHYVGRANNGGIPIILYNSQIWNIIKTRSNRQIHKGELGYN